MAGEWKRLEVGSYSGGMKLTLPGGVVVYASRLRWEVALHTAGRLAAIIEGKEPTEALAARAALGAVARWAEVLANAAKDVL